MNYRVLISTISVLKNKKMALPILKLCNFAH